MSRGVYTSDIDQTLGLAYAALCSSSWLTCSAAHPSSPLLRRLERDEAVQHRMVATLAHRVVVLPLLAEEPVGHDRLTALTRSPQVVT